jgi:hypothetical protein
MANPVRTVVTPPPLKRTLRRGDKGEDVKLVQTILQQEGFFKGTPLGNFLGVTEAAVKHFQGTHIGENGEFLAADGVVGPLTWWALHNPHGDAQRSFIPTPEPVATVSPRLRYVQYLYEMHGRGIREIPDGANYGDGVTPVVNACGFSYGIYWCLAAQAYAWRQVFGEPPLGAMHVHCSTFWNEALKRGQAHPKKNYVPLPGDIAIYNYAGGLKAGNRLTGPGHAAGVARVSEDGRRFNALEGNVGNRFKHSIRNVSESSLVGFVNLFGDEANRPKFQTGITEAPVVTLSLAGSR